MRRYLFVASTVLSVLCAGAPVSGAHAADDSCAEAERNLNYWVYGETGPFNTWRRLCAEGKSAMDALSGARPGAQAVIRQCTSELGAALAARRLDAACQELARSGIPKPTAAAPAPALDGLPACLAELQGTYKEIASQRVLFANVDTEIVAVWQNKDGKPYCDWSIPGRDIKGTVETVGIEGQDLVMDSTSEGYVSRGKIRFDASCGSYSGSFATAGGPVVVRGQKTGATGSGAQ